MWFTLPAVARWGATRWYPDHTGVIGAALAGGFGATPTVVVAALAAGGVGLVATLPRRRRSQPTLRMGGAVAEGTAA